MKKLGLTGKSIDDSSKNSHTQQHFKMPRKKFIDEDNRYSLESRNTETDHNVTVIELDLKIRKEK